MEESCIEGHVDVAAFDSSAPAQSAGSLARRRHVPPWGGPVVVERVTDLIGRTPMLELPLAARDRRLLLKLEQWNPGRSMKDRMAHAMVQAAERSGRLTPGGTIIESSSGNTGTGLAIVAAERGYRLVAVVDHHAARDKIRTMKALGAEIVAVDEDQAEDRVATKAREALAERLEASIPGGVYLRQADNPANAEAYRRTLAVELWQSTGGRITTIVGAVGTGGSLSGTARGLKELDGSVRAVGVEPVGSTIFGGPGGPYLQSGTGTPGGVLVGENVDYALIDTSFKVSDALAFNTARFLGRRLGLLVGGSAGGVIHVALRLANASAPATTTIALVADAGEKYLDTVFDDAWMEKRGLIDTSVERELASLLARRSGANAA